MRPETPLDELFREAMSSLASGVAVVTARRADGQPCGLAATSVVLLQRPPALAARVVAHASRCHAALDRRERFGVHILRADEVEMAQRFAGKGEDKFADVDWGWDGDVPELPARSPTCAAAARRTSAHTTTRS